MQETQVKNELHQKVGVLLASGELTQAQLARQVQYSSATISQWLKGEYKGDVAEVEARIAAEIMRMTARKSRIKLVFAPTQNTQIIQRIADDCLTNSSLGVVIGGAGLGKTSSLKQYVKNNPNTIFLEADQSWGAKVVAQQLCRALGLSSSGTLPGLINNVLEQLRGSGRLIVVDEAEHLPYRALEILRRLQDKSQDSENDDIGIGLLLVGMERLRENLLGSGGQFKQLYSRIQATVRLKPVNDKGLERIVLATLSDLLVTITDDAMRTMIESVKGNVRTLEKLLKASVQTCLNNQSVEIDTEMVEAASETIIL